MEVNQVYSIYFQGGEDKTWPPNLEAWPPSGRPAVLGDRVQESGSGAVLSELTHIIGKGALEPVEDKPALLPGFNLAAHLDQVATADLAGSGSKEGSRCIALKPFFSEQQCKCHHMCLYS